MSIHIGEKIKKRAKEQRIGPTELARMINSSKQNIYSIFLRSSIDSDLLQKISNALNYDFFQYFISSDLQFVSEEKVQYGKKRSNAPTRSYSDVSAELSSVKKQLEEVMKEIVYLKKINLLLEKKGKK